MITNVYLLLVAHFTVPIALLSALLVLNLAVYKTHNVESKLNKFIFWCILSPNIFAILPYAKHKLANNSLSIDNNVVKNTQVYSMNLIMLLTAVVVYTQKRCSKEININEN